MARLPILEYPDPRLRQPSAPVAAFDTGLQRLVDDLVETLHDSRGIGLAAPQAGDHRQVVVIDLSGDASAPEVFINPRILDRRVPALVEESCLSVPGVVGNVLRATELRVEARDSHGRAFERELDGMLAVCLQHEMDHLAGRLFIDHLSWVRRWRIRAAARSRRARAPSASRPDVA